MMYKIKRRKTENQHVEFEKELFRAWKANPNLTVHDLGTAFNCCYTKASRILTRYIKKYGLLN